MNASIADILPVFAATPSAIELPPSLDTFEASAEFGAVTVPDDMIGIEEAERRVAEAVAGAQAGTAAAVEAALAAQAAELTARFEAEREEARRRWAEAEGAALAKAIRTNVARLEEALGESLVHVLEPFFEAATRVKAVAELRVAIADLLAHGGGATVRIRGPEDLLARLEASLDGAAAVAFEAAETAEVTVEADDTTIRSQLQAWAEKLHALLNEVR